MLIRHLRLGLLLALVCASLVASSPGASAQATDPSRANLQRENDQLRERVAQLEARIKKLERENEAMKLELERLRAAKPGAPPPPGTPGTVPTTGDVIPLESQEPLACPDALLAALQASYATQFADRTVEEATKAQYIQDVRKWARTAEREFKGNVEWVIRVDKENLPASPDEPIPFWVIDVQSGKLLHPKVVKAALNRAAASRILENTSITVWDVKGSLGATPTTNAERAEKGLLDFPPFIGPFAEFKYALTIRTAMPHENP
jgi:hypothetical protein